MRRTTDTTEHLLIRLDAEEGRTVLQFKRLCEQKFGKRFQTDQGFRLIMLDGLLASAENWEKQ